MLGYFRMTGRFFKAFPEEVAIASSQLFNHTRFLEILGQPMEGRRLTLDLQGNELAKEGSKCQRCRGGASAIFAPIQATCSPVQTREPAPKGNLPWGP